MGNGGSHEQTMAQLEALPDQVRRTFRRRATPPMTIGRLRTTPRVIIGMKVMRSVLSPPARVRLVVRQLHMGSALVADGPEIQANPAGPS